MKVLIVFVLVFAIGVPSVKSRGRLFGGEVANPVDFKYQALIRVPYIPDSRRNLHCGGSLIHHKWILTAAHCFENGFENGTVVSLGYMNETTYSYQKNATNVIIHEGYYRTRRQVFNDIALIKIPFAGFNQYIASVQLSNTTLLDNQVITLAGRGLRNNTTPSTELRYIMVNVLNNTECGRIFHTQMLDSQFCTYGFFQNGCPGDSGGPGVLDSARIARQVGVLSIATRHCAPNATNAYTLISPYLPWIRTNTELITL